MTEKLYIGELQDGPAVVSCSNIEYLKTFNYLILSVCFIFSRMCAHAENDILITGCFT